MSDQKVKNITGVGRSITKEITPIERATPSIINLEGSLSLIESSIAANWVVDGTQNDRLDAAEIAISSLESTPFVPIGTLMMLPTIASFSSGYLPCAGSAYDGATYPLLYARLGTTFNIGGETAGWFRVPDFRGYFPRGWDNGAGVDPGRSLGSKQTDKFKSHLHRSWGSTSNRTDDCGGLFGGPVRAMAGTSSGTGNQYRSTFPATGHNIMEETGDTETRPKNIAVFFVIKCDD